MKKKINVSCPMDCWDLCRFIVTIENRQITKFAGDPNHPVTRGFTCKKGKNLVQRMLHPDRIRHPLIKINNEFVKISYQEALEIIADKLESIKEKFGTTAILNYSSDGYGGIKNKIQSIFFNCFGGVTQPKGNLCWGAGIAAQKYDFGSAKGHFPDDVLNAGTILVWGQNPKDTGIHLYALLKQAQKQGSRIIVIDPVKTATAKAFDEYVRIRPSTDGALALAMANVIIENNLHDKDFIKNHVLGFRRFKAYAAGFTLEKAEQITGISAETIKALALQYANSKTASIHIGFGMQRYCNGGNNVRCIDALASITGNIGKKGCGANYAAKSISPYLYGLAKKSNVYAKNQRFFTIGKLGQFLDQVQDPPVKAIFVAYANPLTQSPDLKKVIKHFSKIEFKVVFDHFMTDTAQQADIVLPAAFVFEQDDLFATSMYSPVLNYSQKALDPPEKVIPEFEFFLELAKRMGLNNLGFKDSQEYLKKSAKPLLEKLGKNFGQLSDAYLMIKTDEIAWENKAFETPSGKIELYSERALQEGLSPMASFIEPIKGNDQLPLRFLSCKTIDSMHSQGFIFNNDVPIVYVNQNTACKFDVQNETHVFVKAENAQLKVKLCIDESIHNDIAFMYQGWWLKSGAVNLLTNSSISDMGKQAAYYDSFVSIEKIE